MHWYDTGGGLVVHHKPWDQTKDDLNPQSSKSHINMVWFDIFSEFDKYLKFYRYLTDIVWPAIYGPKSILENLI